MPDKAALAEAFDTSEIFFRTKSNIPEHCTNSHSFEYSYVET